MSVCVCPFVRVYTISRKVLQVFKFGIDQSMASSLLSVEFDFQPNRMTFTDFVIYFI